MAELQKVRYFCLRTVSGTNKATLVQSLEAKVGVPPLPLHINNMQARILLQSARSGIDQVNGEDISKVRQFLSCT